MRYGKFDGRVPERLKEEIAAGHFREDLYHRLSVIIIHVPPLHERKADIPLLADYFMADICAEQGKPLIFFDEAAYDALKDLKWTGNIRELRNVVERLIILSGKTITAGDVANYVMLRG